MQLVFLHFVLFYVLFLSVLFGIVESTINVVLKNCIFTVLIVILQAAIEKQEFGLDLPSAQKHQQNHHIQHDAVLAFQDELSELKKMEVDFLL